MKLAVITMKQCQLLRGLKPRSYLAFGSCGAARRMIEHIIEDQHGRIEKLRVSCRDCILAQLLQGSYIVGQPVLLPEGLIRFVAVYTNATRRTISRNKSRLVSVEIIDARSLLLTPRQRAVLRMLGDSATITGIASRLGVSRAAAGKLVRRTLQKLALLYAAEPKAARAQ
ncbi:MAG TPA: hypothetical protein EYP33_06060 [Pyrodictium sp.]|nr:hypothetical protein [Pyrodictium sp.]